jgi:hypothetical protein
MVTPIASTFDLHHHVNGLIVWIVQTTLQESVSLFLQGVQIELRSAALPEQKAVQEGYGDITVGSAFAQDVLARVLVDCSFIGVLRQNRCHIEHARDYDRGNKDFRDKVSHKYVPTLDRILTNPAFNSGADRKALI